MVHAMRLFLLRVGRDLALDDRRSRGNNEEHHMPKTFPIIIDVEEIALGAVLRKLNDMAGIAKLHLDLGRGGEKGQEALADQAVPLRQRGATREVTVLKLLADGPKSSRDIQKLLGGRTTAYAVLHTLRKKGLTEAGGGLSTHQLTAKGRALLKGMTAPPKALPTPDGAQRDARGHLPKGVSEGFVLAAIAHSDRPLMPRDLAPGLAPHGFTTKAVESAMKRAKGHGLIRNTGKGYELTAKGIKEAQAPSGLNGTGAASHG